MQIRTFDSVLSTPAGGPSSTEALGLEPAGLAVIETGGSYEQADSLKAAFDGAPGTGTNVFDHDLDTVAQHPGIGVVLRHPYVRAWAARCLELRPACSGCLCAYGGK